MNPSTGIVRIPSEHPDEVAERDLGPDFPRFGRERVGTRRRMSVWAALIDYQASVDEPPAGESW